MRHYFRALPFCLLWLFLGLAPARASELFCQAEVGTAPASSFDMDTAQLARFLTKAFNLAELPRNADVVLMTDLPATRADLEGNWEDRLTLVHRWAAAMQTIFSEGSVRLLYYPTVGQHNRPLPAKGWLLEQFSSLPLLSAEDAREAARAASKHSLAVAQLDDWLGKANLVLSLPRYSATAPLSEKSVENGWPFRTLSIPGFNSALLPIFGSDYGRIANRIAQLKPLVDEAVRAEIRFALNGPAVQLPGVEPAYVLNLDLRGRSATAEPAVARDWPYPGERALDNAPIGELWIVPREGSESETSGFLPVQIGQELVVFEVQQNRLRRVLTTGWASERQAELIKEPGYANLGELGFGVLASLGFPPLSVHNDAATLVNEKLTLHIANGLSQHLGGTVGDGAFTTMAPVHVDYVYLPQMQPLISLAEVLLHFNGKGPVTIMRDDRYVIFD